MMARIQLWSLIVVAAMLLGSCLFRPAMIHIGDPNKYTITKGMTQDEVKAILGNWHEYYADDDGERWYYYLDPLGLTTLAIQFNKDGRVVSTWT